MTKELDYGLVLITAGKHSGRAAYYDDDSINERAIVYWGTPCLSDYALIPKKYLMNIDSVEATRLGWKHEVQATTY